MPSIRKIHYSHPIIFVQKLEKLLKTYLLSKILHSCKTASIVKELRRKKKAFETWCNRKRLKISWTGGHILGTMGRDDQEWSKESIDVSNWLIKFFQYFLAIMISI